MIRWLQSMFGGTPNAAKGNPGNNMTAPEPAEPNTLTDGDAMRLGYIPIRMIPFATRLATEQERERVNRILTHPASVGRSKLAIRLALGSMPADVAITVLEEAGLEDDAQAQIDDAVERILAAGEER